MNNKIDLDDFPKRPKMNLKIFETGGNPNLLSSVCNEDIIGDPWNGYALAYKVAGLSYIEKIEEDGFLYNTFGYPVFFICRHYVELRLKEILLHSMILLNEIPSHTNSINKKRTATNWNDELKCHNILELWKKCEQRLKKIDHWDKISDLDPETAKDCRTIEYCINELSKYDGNSEAFRYPVNSYGNVLLDNTNVQTLNVHALKDMMTWLSEMLDGISTGISEETNRVFEERAEHFGDYDTDF